MNKAVLFWQENSCMVVTDNQNFIINFDSADTIQTRVQKLIEQINAKFLNIQQAVLLLSDELVFTAMVSTDKLPKRNKTQALYYQLEDYLPIDAEELTAEFITASPAQNFAYAIKTANLENIINALEDAGVEISSSSSAIAEIALKSNLLQHDYFVLQADNSFEIAKLVNSKIVKISRAESQEELQQKILSDQLVSDSVSSQLSIATNVKLNLQSTGFEISETEYDFADQLASLITKRPAMNFRKEKLAPKSQWSKHGLLINATVVLLCLMPLVLLLGIYLRTQEYKNLAKKNRRAQREVFARIYPNEKPPVNVARVLQNRINTRNFAKSPLPAKYSHNALIALNELLKTIPQKFQLRLTHIKASGNKIQLRGFIKKTGSTINPEFLASYLRENGFEVEPVTLDSKYNKYYPFDIDATYKGTANE